jgi:hypothetical protein
MYDPDKDEVIEEEMAEFSALEQVAAELRAQGLGWECPYCCSDVAAAMEACRECGYPSL